MISATINAHNLLRTGILMTFLFFGGAMLIIPQNARAVVCKNQGGAYQEFSTMRAANEAGSAAYIGGVGGFVVYCGSCADASAGRVLTTGDCPDDQEQQAAVVDAGGTIIGYTNPLCPANQPCTVPIIIGNIIRAVLGVVGSIALLMFVYGGFTWMLAHGDSEKVTKARQILTWATAGIVVIFASYMLVDFIIKAALE